MVKCPVCGNIRLLLGKKKKGKELSKELHYTCMECGYTWIKGIENPPLQRAERIKRAAFEIMGYFDDLLEENDIYIPDRFREGDPQEARIYGETFADLMDKIKTKLTEI